LGGDADDLVPINPDYTERLIISISAFTYAMCGVRGHAAS
jgi:hypothetical protein